MGKRMKPETMISFDRNKLIDEFAVLKYSALYSNECTLNRRHCVSRHTSTSLCAVDGVGWNVAGNMDRHWNE